jgi:hypothetical protein
LHELEGPGVAEEHHDRGRLEEKYMQSNEWKRVPVLDYDIDRLSGKLMYYCYSPGRAGEPCMPWAATSRLYLILA